LFFFSSRRRHTRSTRDWSSDVCSSDLGTVMYTHWAVASLLVPVMFLMWIVYTDWRSPIADIRELDLLNDPELRLQGIISKLLPRSEERRVGKEWKRRRGRTQ